MRQFRARGIHTALDTCGACVWAQMQPLLPYHKLGSGKYEAIGKRWEMPACEPPSDAAMQAHRAYLARGGVRCVRGGDREQDAERVTND